MKTLKIFLNLAILWVVSIAFFSCNPSIKGEGKVSDKDSILTAFTDIHLHGNFNAFFMNDSVYSVKIEANENLIKNLIIKNEDGQLAISQDKSVSSFDIFKVIISGRNLKEIMLHDNTTMEVQGQINQEKISVTLLDNSKFIGNLAVSDILIKQNGNSSSNFSGSASNAEVRLKENASFMSPLFNISEGEFYLSDNAQAKTVTLKSLEGEGSDNSKLFYKGDPNKKFTTTEQAVCEKK